MPSSRPNCHLVHRPYNQARRVGGHALGAKHTAFSMIPGNGVYRVRRRRFAEARSDSTNGGSGNGVSIIRLVSIVTLSVASSMFWRRSSTSATSSLTVDVELELVDVELVLRAVASAGEASTAATRRTKLVTALCSCI